MKLKISEVAKELGLSSKVVISKAKEVGLDLNPKSNITPEEAQKIAEYIMNAPSKSKQEEKKVTKKVVKKETKPETAKEAIKRKRRTGIKIVKKKKVATKETPSENETNNGVSGLELLKQEKENLKKLEKNKTQSVKKKKQPKVVKASEKGSIIEIDKDFSDDMDFTKDEVVLLDLSDTLRKDFLVENEDNNKKRKTNTNKNTSNQKKQPQKKKTLDKAAPKKRRKKQAKKIDLSEVTYKISTESRLHEFAKIINKDINEIIDLLTDLGEEVEPNTFLNADLIEILADELGINIELENPIEEFDYVSKYDSVKDDEKDLQPRVPIVTIMGHVDHGKTSLLDYIRNSRVAAKEAGGITQHVGAYMVEKDGKKVTFIDTPGHEAFTSMRARGAKITDIAIIVVAADDGVMPQTREAIKHAQAANVPIIIAVNKMDKPQANPDLVKTQLSELGIVTTEWGGDYEFVYVSAKTGEGVDTLLDTITIQAEIMELKANPKREAKIVVIESEIQKGRGAVSTIIVQNGTLKKGDSIVVGTTYGKIRSILNDLGKNLKDLKPGEPGLIFGLNDVPDAGDIGVVVKNDKIARDYAEKWKNYLRQKELSVSNEVTLEDIQQMLIEGNIKKLPVIVKADTKGTVEAIKSSLEKLQNEEVKVNVIQDGVGPITENDIILASATETPAIVVGFNVRPTAEAQRAAKRDGIEINLYSIIYDLVDDIKDLLSGMLSSKVREEITGTAEVRDVFVVPKIGTVAGCMVTNGTIYRDNYARVIRDGVVIYDSRLVSLKRFKDDVKEVGKGFECGLMVENYNDVRVGDIIESYKKIEEKAKFE